MLREPQKGQPITADWGREVVKAIRENVVIGGKGIRVAAGPSGVVISAVPDNTPAPRAAAGGHPRPFDLTVEDGFVKLSNAFIQIGDGLHNGGLGVQLQTALPPGPQDLYLMIQRTGTGGGAAVTLSLAWAAAGGRPDTADGMLFPVALYRLDAAGKVLCDYRGMAAVMYA